MEDYAINSFKARKYKSPQKLYNFPMEEVPIQQVSIILIQLELKDTFYDNVLSCPGNMQRKKRDGTELSMPMVCHKHTHMKTHVEMNMKTVYIDSHIIYNGYG